MEAVDEETDACERMIVEGAADEEAATADDAAADDEAAPLTGTAVVFDGSAELLAEEAEEARVIVEAAVEETLAA